MLRNTQQTGISITVLISTFCSQIVAVLDDELKKRNPNGHKLVGIVVALCKTVTAGTWRLKCRLMADQFKIVSEAVSELRRSRKKGE